MGKSSHKDTTQQQTTQPLDPAVTAAYNNLLSQSQSVAAQPLKLYQGQVVAPLTPLQNTAIQDVQNSSSLAAPYLTSAAGYANQAATPLNLTPFNSANVNQYYSPYQNDVINSTMALENLQNAQQQQSLAGNITAAGAWGGDRSAVLQSQLAGQQTLANNTTNAGLETQGYQGALSEFNAQQQAALQAQQANNQNAAMAAYSLGSIGTATQNAGLSGANAMLNAGTLQQQLQQEQLNVPYEQYLQTLAYPYQNLSFLASMFPGIAQGTGSQSYGTGQQTSTQPFSIFHRGGRTRLADGGQGGNAGGFSLGASGPTMLEMLEGGQMARDAGGYYGGSIAAPPNLSTSYIPQSSPGSAGGYTTPGLNMNFGGGDTAPGTSLAGDITKGTGAYNAASGLLGHFASTGGGDAGMSGIADMGAGIGGDIAGGGSGFLGFLGDAGSAIGDAATAALAFVGLEKGGRARLADGGEDDMAGMEDAVAPQSIAAAPQPIYATDEDATALPGTSSTVAPESIAPRWDDGTPVAQGPAPANDNPAMGDSLGVPHAARTVWTPPEASPDWGHVVLSGLASALANRSLGHGLAAGIQEYDEEMDQHPVVDHSGSSIMVQYGGKGQPRQLFDTGIPTEAALNAKATSDYRQSLIGNAQDRIAAQRKAEQDRSDAATAKLAEQAQRDAERAAYNNQIADIRAQLANQGKFGQIVPGKGDDGTGKMVDGVWSNDLKTGHPVFTPGVSLQARAPAPKTATPLSDQAALTNAQRDYDRFFPAQKPAPNNPGFDIYGQPLKARPVPPEGMQAWIKNRAAGYMKGQTPAATPAPQAAPANANTPPPVVPPRPADVPPNAQWSPSKKSWWWQNNGQWQNKAA